MHSAPLRHMDFLAGNEACLLHPPLHKPHNRGVTLNPVRWYLAHQRVQTQLIKLLHAHIVSAAARVAQAARPSPISADTSHGRQTQSEPRSNRPGARLQLWWVQIIN